MKSPALLPRSGPLGWLDQLIGPGATPAEITLQLLPPIAAMIAAPAYALTLPMEWSGWQLGVISVLGFDLVGGVLTNATSAAKRWYHRPGQGWRQHLAFVMLHFVHIAVVALFLRGGDWPFFFAISGYLLGASVLILRVPRYLQRPVALGLYGLSSLGDRYCWMPTPGMEWFLSLFFLKLLVSHLLYETPYQPEPSQQSS